MASSNDTRASAQLIRANASQPALRGARGAPVRFVATQSGASQDYERRGDCPRRSSRGPIEAPRPPCAGDLKSSRPSEGSAITSRSPRSRPSTSWRLSVPNRSTRRSVGRFSRSNVSATSSSKRVPASREFGSGAKRAVSSRGTNSGDSSSGGATAGLRQENRSVKPPPRRRGHGTQVTRRLDIPAT
jgi:hypothetical protein